MSWWWLTLGSNCLWWCTRDWLYDELIILANFTASSMQTPKLERSQNTATHIILGCISYTPWVPVILFLYFSNMNYGIKMWKAHAYLKISSGTEHPLREELSREKWSRFKRVQSWVSCKRCCLAGLWVCWHCIQRRIGTCASCIQGNILGQHHSGQKVQKSEPCGVPQQLTESILSELCVHGFLYRKFSRLNHILQLHILLLE